MNATSFISSVELVSPTGLHHVPKLASGDEFRMNP